MDQDILVFEIDEHRFGVDADLVVEVVRAVTPIPLPRVPDVVMGIINLRGEVVPVLDTRKTLRLEAGTVRHTDHFLILRDGNMRYAIHADRAIDLAPLPTDSSDAGVETTEPIGRLANTTLGFVQRLNPCDLLSDADRSALSLIVSSTPANETQG